MKFSQVMKWLLLSAALVVFTACGGGSGGGDQNTTSDTTAPTITLKGANPLELTQGTAYREPGATATDDVDDNVSVTISGSVDSSKVGTYTVTYKAKDSAGNEAVKTRTVKVVSPPVLKTTITGYAYKGVVMGAVVDIYDFSGNAKGKLLASGTISDSKYQIDETDTKKLYLLEAKADVNNTAYYIDEDNGNNVHLEKIVLKSICSNSDECIISPLTTLATELYLKGVFKDYDIAQKRISNIFGLSFDKLNKVKPNIEKLGSTVENSQENEYALALLSLVAFQNEINRLTSTDFSFDNLMKLIEDDVSDGIFDGKENNISLTVQDGNTTLNIGDIPKKLSQAGSKSLSAKNPILLNEMKGYFLRAATASRAIEPPSVEIRSNENIRLNEKSILSAQGSKSPFGYPLTYSWSIKTSPAGANSIFSTPTDVNTFLTVDTEGIYTISLEVSDGQNRVSKDINITADLDGDGSLSSEDLDIDGDGILNTIDKFPNNPAEFLDSDENGNGNFAQLDEDGDGVSDVEDDYPFDSSRSQITTFNETEFNGNLNDANTLTGSLPYKISGAIDASGSDDDYFKFNSTSGSIVSVSLTKSYTSFEPILSVVDSSGNSLPAINSITDTNTTILTFRIPMDDTFTLIVTDKNSHSGAEYTYMVKIFADNDMDGVSNEYEKAIGSNENSSDSDGDGIKDYYEIYTNSFDIDSDGIPNWLDNDSDGDTIPDGKEALRDLDNDGLLNPFDTDSDGNGVLDSVEVGTNPDSALDTDGDGFADYTDIDDDNDGVLDTNDNNRLVVADIDSTSSISLQGIIDSKDISNFAQSGGSLKIVGENFTSSAIVVLVDATGVYNLTPTDVNSTNITVSLPNIKGKAQIRVYDNSKLTTSGVVTIVDTTDPIIFEVSYPNSQTYALENDTITLTGINLSNVTSVKVNGTSVITTSSTDTSVTFVATNALSSGSVIASTLNANTNDLSVFIGRQITGTVTLPQGSPYNFSDLKIEFAGVESSINNDGTFTMVAQNNDSSSITVFTPEDANGSISIYLSALVLSDMNSNITVDTNSTATSIMFSALNASSSDKNKTEEIYNIIKSNNDIFANHLAQNIGNDSYYISKASAEYINALGESKTTVYNILKDNSLIRNISVNRSLFVNEIDDVSVWKDGDPINGKIRIDNDTMVFLDYMITNISNGKIIKPYLNQYYGSALIGPQDPSFFMYWASSSDYDVSYQSSKITVITPKFKGMTTANFNTLPQYKLALRTVLSQGIFPIVNEAIGFNMSDGATKVLLEKILIPAINGGAIDHWRSGEVGKGFEKFLGDLIKAMATDGVKEILKNQMSLDSKAIANIATNIIGFAVPTKAISLAGTAVDLGKTVIDFATIEDEIVFNVNFPIIIEDIYPSSIKKNGSSKMIVIEGKGLENYCSNFDLKWVDGTYLPPKYHNTCVEWHYPKVKITSSSNTEELALYKRMEGQYYFNIPANFIENAIDDINVTVEHVYNDEQYIDELVDITVSAPQVISIVDELSITNITPDSGSTGTKVTISGAGFSTNKLENSVYFTTASGAVMGTVVEATESQLEVQVPKGTITGDVWVQVDNEESNKLNFTVSTTQVTIEFGDNGSATDDTFSLDFDNGKTVKTTPSAVVTDSAIVEMETGVNYTVKLTGITAPDDVGTYYISFPSEIEVISGPSLSGSDLTAGVVKTWIIKLASTSRSINRAVNQSIRYTPSNAVVIQPEVR